MFIVQLAGAERFAWPHTSSIKGASGPTTKAIQNQTRGDLSRSRAISVENGIAASEAIKKSQLI
jgi:hypothetical protein